MIVGEEGVIRRIMASIAKVAQHTHNHRERSFVHRSDNTLVDRKCYIITMQETMFNANDNDDIDRVTFTSRLVIFVS